MEKQVGYSDRVIARLAYRDAIGPSRLQVEEVEITPVISKCSISIIGGLVHDCNAGTMKHSIPWCLNRARNIAIGFLGINLDLGYRQEKNSNNRG